MQQMTPKSLTGDNSSAQAGKIETSSEQLGALALETIPVVMRAIRKLMRVGGESDLTVPQFRALGFIDRHRGTSLKALADHLGMSMPGASRLVQALVERELVERTIAGDRRYVTLNLLSKGERERAIARQRTLEGLDAALQRLRPAERKAIAKALPALRDLFSTEPPSP